MCCLFQTNNIYWVAQSIDTAEALSSLFFEDIRGVLDSLGRIEGPFDKPIKEGVDRRPPFMVIEQEDLDRLITKGGFIRSISDKRTHLR